MTEARSEGLIEAGKQKSESCKACHNEDGNSSAGSFPKIAGQPEKYLKEQLVEFKKGDKGNRNNSIMLPYVEPLTDQDMDDLAAYFHAQVTSLGKAQQSTLLMGESLYRGGNLVKQVPSCSGCHGVHGEGNELAGIPRLSGQQSNYVLSQLISFKKDERKNDRNSIMRDIAKLMSEEEMEAVSNYVSGLH
ncbi:MAG: cytochrome c4 [Francisellaceae bacterium]|nr:cytochrome c4 [Francisellaceae bacterium]